MTSGSWSAPALKSVGGLTPSKTRLPTWRPKQLASRCKEPILPKLILTSSYLPRSHPIIFFLVLVSCCSVNLDLTGASLLSIFAMHAQVLFTHYRLLINS